jgi:hypothetical protein
MEIRYKIHIFPKRRKEKREKEKRGLIVVRVKRVIIF